MAEDRAENFLQKHGFDLKWTAKGRTCPPGEEGCIVGKHDHGNQLTVLLKRIDGPNLIKTSDGVLRKRPVHGFTFEYWQASADDGLPTVEEIVKHIAIVQTWPVDPDDVFDELGGRVRPSKAFAMAKLSKRFKEFFTSKELMELGKVR